MALLDWEGFDRETANLGIFSEFTGDITADGNGAFSYGRAFFRGTWQANACSRISFFPLTQTLFANFHLLITAYYNQVRFIFMDGSTNQLYFQIGVSGIPQIYRGDGTLLASASIAPATNVYHFFQIRAHIADSGGTCEVRMNGTPIITFTGDTKNTANAGANGWKVESSNGSLMRFDNLIIFSSTGNAPNNWTPETRIWDELPNGAGGTTQWSPSAGANWQCVDEQPSNGDTDYVSASSSPLTDTYATPASATAGSVIYAVACHCTARKDDAGSNEIDGIVRVSSTNYAKGEAKAIAGTYARYRWLWDLNPNTGNAWTPAEANAAEIGIRRTV